MQELEEENRMLLKQIKKTLLICENLKETNKLREELYNDAKKDDEESIIIIVWGIPCLILGVLIGMHIWISFWN